VVLRFSPYTFPIKRAEFAQGLFSTICVCCWGARVSVKPLRLNYYFDSRNAKSGLFSCVNGGYTARTQELAQRPAL
jgi:hypothetical protein